VPRAKSKGLPAKSVATIVASVGFGLILVYIVVGVVINKRKGQPLAFGS
jgi:hypothetical protein